MLPLGWLGVEGVNEPPLRWCNLTADEQQSLMSLWTIFRSPLMYGGDLQHPDPLSLGLITNVEALAITDRSTNTECLRSDPSLAMWRSDAADWQQSGISYFSLHNIDDSPLLFYLLSTADVRGQQTAGSCTLRDIWARQDIQHGTNFSFSLRPHQSGLYSLHSCSGAEQSQKQHRHARPAPA